MTNIKKILLPTDFSKNADRALKTALFLAEGFGAEVHVFHAVVLHADDPNDPAHHFPDSAELHKLLEELASTAIEKRVGHSVSSDITIRTERRRAIAAAPAILEYAQEMDADLIVLGTHGHRAPARFLLGSVVEEVVRSAGCPVLTVRLTKELAADPSLERIVVPVDFSGHSSTALSMAGDLARRWKAKVDLVHVVEELGYPTFYDLSLSADLTRRVIARAEEALAAIAAAELDAETSVEMHVLSASKAAPRIVSYAQESGADLIVLPRLGQSGLEHLFFGSTAERVVQQSSVAVLVTKPEESSS